MLDSNASCCSATAWQPRSKRFGLWGFSFLLLHLGLFLQYNFLAAALRLQLEDLVSSNRAVVGDHSVELGLVWACPGPWAQLFLRSVGVHAQKSQHRHCWGTAGRLWDEMDKVQLCPLCCPHSVMRTARSTTTHCTWGCPAARRITMAAPTSPPASSSSAAPKRPSQSPHSSLLPNWPRMVSGWSLRIAQGSRN